MSKKPKDTNDDPGHAPEDDIDPDIAAQEALQKKFIAEALADDKTAQPEGYGDPAEMPQRFFTGGATADEKAAWIEAHGGPKVEGVVEPGHAEPKAEGDVAPE